MRWALAMVGFAAAFFVSVDASPQTASRTQARDETSPTGTRSDIPVDGAHDSESAGTRHGDSIQGGPSPSAWPCRLLVVTDLRDVVDLAWRTSVTFRNQCRTIAAARAVVIVQTSADLWRAQARIGRSEGVTVARIRVSHKAKAVEAIELIAHELEHVLERVEGVRLQMESHRPGSRVSLLSGGAFETQRAIDAGHRVAHEVRSATPTHVKASMTSPGRSIDRPLKTVTTGRPVTLLAPVMTARGTSLHLTSPR